MPDPRSKGVGNDRPDRSEKSEQAERLARKRDELLAFREAGVLTETELQEQLAKFRWGIP
jgi:hypothetical protein